MKTTGGMAPPFLTSALDGREWSASRLSSFTPGERGRRYPLGWVGLRAGLDIMEKRKISYPCRESNRGRRLVVSRRAAQLPNDTE
jgi:hypothetical protein